MEHFETQDISIGLIWADRLDNSIGVAFIISLSTIKKGTALLNQKDYFFKTSGDLLLMKIRIIGTESLGVRGLSCVVEVENRKIFIDPGLALGYLRNGLMPHPVQIGVGCIIRERILEALEDSTDIVISHFHGDHIPLYNANPFQLSVNQIKKISPDCKIWANESNTKMRQREAGIILGLNKSINKAKGQIDSFLFFLEPVAHGEANTHQGTVTMTKITDGKTVFLHASDIQFLDEIAVDKIIEHKPDIVLASGPPIYLEDYMKNKMEKAWNNTFKLSNEVKTLILDHHLLRCEKGLSWLSKLSTLSVNEVICAADFMKFERHVLEAWRTKFYNDIPVPHNWHQLYANNQVTTTEYLDVARKKYPWFKY
jgi:hypothetical protein